MMNIRPNDYSVHILGSKNAMKPQERQQSGRYRDQRRGAGKQRANFHRLLFQQELGIENLVNFFQVGCRAGIEILAARHVRLIQFLCRCNG